MTSFIDRRSHLLHNKTYTVTLKASGFYLTLHIALLKAASCKEN